jgi:protein-S-isoprenylcysteine O-methyltransferase Ste14
MGSRLDLGRVVMVPLAAIMIILDVASAAGRAGPGRWLGALLPCAFYLLIIGGYLRRGPAAATSGSATGHAAAALATVLPLVLPALHGAPPAPALGYAADALMLAGTGWAVWSLHCLGRSLSVLAQARRVVDRGPYRWVRHPLYTGEIVSTLGLALAAGSAPALAGWLVFGGLQAYRALREEQVLTRALPGYGAYRARTAALIPALRRRPDGRR